MTVRTLPRLCAPLAWAPTAIPHVTEHRVEALVGEMAELVHVVGKPGETRLGAWA